MTGNFPDPATHRLLSPPANPRPRLHKSLLRLHKSKEITIREKCRHRLRLVQTEDGKQQTADSRQKQEAEKGSRQLLQPVFKQVGHQQQIRFRQLLVMLVRQQRAART